MNVFDVRWSQFADLKGNVARLTQDQSTTKRLTLGNSYETAYKMFK